LSAVLVTVSYDTDTSEIFVNFEAEHRFGELPVRMFSGADEGDNSYRLQNDDYLQLSLSRHFWRLLRTLPEVRRALPATPGSAGSRR